MSRVEIETIAEALLALLDERPYDEWQSGAEARKWSDLRTRLEAIVKDAGK